MEGTTDDEGDDAVAADRTGKSKTFFTDPTGSGKYSPERDFWKAVEKGIVLRLRADGKLHG